MREVIMKLEERLGEGFVGRWEEARVAVLALLTKQHAVFIGEPGTAKSAIIRRLSQLVKARFFYYLISKYTVPDELIGPIDPVKYREGKFVRNVRGKLPEAELAFIDEVFKGNSETLNALLMIMNERLFVDTDGTVYQVPLWSLFGASNEVPRDSELQAFYDRFLLKHFVRRIDSSFLEQAIIHNIRNQNERVEPVATLDDIRRVYDEVTVFMMNHSSAIAKVVSQLVVLLRQHGIFISDRTATSPQHLPRLIATYAYVYGTDLRKASIGVSKYVLQSEELLQEYKKALDEIMPPEIREAQDRLEKAQLFAADGNISAAKKNALESLQLAQALFSKPDKVEMYKEELQELISAAERLINELSRIEQELAKYKRAR